MNTKSKEYLALQKKWYKKLEKQGFEDAEQLDGQLKAWASSYFSARYHPDAFNANTEYYRLAGQFLHSHTFKNDREKKIWSLHASGETFRAIAKTLNITHTKAHSCVQRLLKEMKATWK